MKLTSIKYRSHLYLLILIAGTIFFIPNIFVNRFIVAPSLWMQACIGVGFVGYILLIKRAVSIPGRFFLLLILSWTIYHICHNWVNTENIISIIAHVGVFLLLYAVWANIKDKKVFFIILTSLGLVISLWGLAQLFGILRPYNGSFRITGPFDNPAGISALLAALLPFSLYCHKCFKSKYRWISIVISCLIVSVIILSKARAAIIGTTVILILFAINLLYSRNIRLNLVHYIALLTAFILLFAGLFFVKKDSANGRLLIWKCSVDLVMEKPLLGHGGNGFNANYMNRQATFFTKNPNSKYVMLADNVREPFNEFLKWSVNYGIIGILLTLSLIIVPIWSSRKQKSSEIFFMRLSLLSIGISALFSYPFNYPVIQLMTVALLAFLLAEGKGKQTLNINNLHGKAISILLAITLLSATAYQAFIERGWHVIAHKSLRGETEEMLPRYQSLHTHLRYNELFLYNYAAELNVVKQNEESLRIAKECNALWADYDLQMLMADNCQHLLRYDEAEVYLKQASTMCPVKFMPLYKLTELYVETDQNGKALFLAQQIMNKEVKVTSPTISSIKNKMQKLLDETNSIMKK